MNLNLHLVPEHVLVVVISCYIGYRVYRLPAVGANAQLQPQGDLPGAIAATAAAVVILAFLFSLGGDAGSKSENGPHPTPTETTLVESEAPSLTPSHSPSHP
ncbi:hypothetical protein AB0G67_47675 [Streptomyces sp. NPDC021056]|uniref:hypothetical protein n=1 Tax=Streptomyces sp. NPDC021056 TaxID=3155012 RepID=UPI0033C67A62